MWKQGCFSLFSALALSVLVSCTGGTMWTGANMVYDRHDVYKKVGDYRLYVTINNKLSHDKYFRCSNCALDIVAFNGDVLIAGHVPTTEMFSELQRRLATVQGYRRLFNEVRKLNVPSNAVHDSWLTTKIRSKIFADDSIDPNAFKIVTADGVVYLMGDVRLEEGEKVVTIARRTKGVTHVVKMMKYLVYQK